MVSPQEREFRTKLKEAARPSGEEFRERRRQVSEVARKMHYGEVEHRSIYGEASPKEAEEMLDEGIELHPLPVLPEDRN